MKYAYWFSKGCTQWLSRYINLNGNCNGHSLKVQFLVFFFNSSFILLYRSYEMRLPICERMCPVVFKIYQFQWEMWWTWAESCAKGTSFWSFSSIIFLFCSIIATKYAYQFAKGCAHWVSRYINFSGKWAVHLLKVRVFDLFLQLFFYFALS